MLYYSDRERIYMANKRRKKKTIRFFDYSLLAIIVFLVCFGLVMLFSSSSHESLTLYGDSMYYLKLQIRNVVLGFVAMMFVSRINYKFYEKYCVHLFWLAMFLMFLVYATPLGVEVNGARRWLRLPGIQIQPSELMKIAVIILIPYLVGRMGDKVHTLKGTMVILAVGFVAFLGVFKLTDNLSTAVIVFGIVCVLIFVVHKKTAIFLWIAGAGVTAFFVGSFILGKVLENSTDFRLRRILAWLNPEKYAASGAYQTIQGLYAIGSGGFFGKGLGNSAQKMMIPEVQNDMILTVICEELGVFGAIIVFLLFGLLLYRLMFIAQNAPDMYSSLVVTGIFAHIAIQVILNVAVVTNVIPTTGITLPFISYGGTAIIFLMVELGIALGISRTIKIEE